MVIESALEATLNAIRAGKLVLISPLITSTEGLCVASTICIPAARPFCASLIMALEMFLPAALISGDPPEADMVRSAYSSTIVIIYGRKLCPLLGFNLLSLNILL